MFTGLVLTLASLLAELPSQCVGARGGALSSERVQERKGAVTLAEDLAVPRIESPSSFQLC